ncbi:MAG: rhodanese-like domain-containing protein [Jannaschia helgolandensis]|jgi:rhodanese-related sulfurtransferase|uniref:Rhodanese-related sulfurtransferase n=1 Tax=Jannaschia helgolandensis TaxID=188906 RepID=A0A1H7QB59_9RHOB|nr:rhodanese-like domain-containing protein [Jannaschia helgolandensis]SEL44884.1 Rhodanese-related sulfurtransferase [Jannaschia helgolandensis]
MSKSMKDLVADARSHIDTISPAEAHEAMQGGDMILDVREPAELDNDGAVDGAVHIPRGLVEAQADPETGKGNAALTARRDGGGRVHVLCASGARAALAADSLKQMGYDATVIDGGLAAWKKAGLPLRS